MGEGKGKVVEVVREEETAAVTVDEVGSYVHSVTNVGPNLITRRKEESCK